MLVFQVPERRHDKEHVPYRQTVRDMPGLTPKIIYSSVKIGVE